jgi:hypothetical protein
MNLEEIFGLQKPIEFILQILMIDLYDRDILNLTIL